MRQVRESSKKLTARLRCCSELFYNIKDVYISFILPLFSVISILLLRAANINMDSDPIWSIEVGNWINANKTVPYVDVFSWTVFGEQWFSNSWLFCWLMYLADQYLGYLGVAILVLVPCLITGYFLYFICKNFNNSSFTLLIYMVSIFLLLHFSTTPRAYIFTFTFVAIIFYLIRFKRETNLIYFIPFVFLLWANIQSSMKFGIIILFIEALVGTIFYKEKKLWPVVILSFLATLINPYGFGFWDVSFSGLFDLGTTHIAEWRAPDFNNLGTLILYSFMFLIGLFGASRLKDEINNKKYDRDRIMILFWFFAAFCYSLTTIRAIHYVLLLLGPCFAAFATRSLRENKFLKLFALGFAIFFLIISLSSSLPKLPLVLEPLNGKPVSFVEYLQENTWLNENTSEMIPAEAVDYLKERPYMAERVFNSYIFGAYMMYQDLEVFIDARESVFTRHSVTEDYIDLTSMNKDPELIIAKYDINTFLLSQDERLAFYLDLHPEWENTYRDDTAVIFTRVNLE